MAMLDKQNNKKNICITIIFISQRTIILNCFVPQVWPPSKTSLCKVSNAVCCEEKLDFDNTSSSLPVFCDADIQNNLPYNSHTASTDDYDQLDKHSS